MKTYALYSLETKNQSTSPQNFSESYYGAWINLCSVFLLCYLEFFQATYQLKVNAEAATLSIATIKESMI